MFETKFVVMNGTLFYAQYTLSWSLTIFEMKTVEWMHHNCYSVHTFSDFPDFKLSPCDEYWYFGFGVLHGVQVNLVDDVSGTTVGPIFTGQESRG
jgi:hypothetical protein